MESHDKTMEDHREEINWIGFNRRFRWSNARYDNLSSQDEKVVFQIGNPSNLSDSGNISDTFYVKINIENIWNKVVFPDSKMTVRVVYL